VGQRRRHLARGDAREGQQEPAGDDARALDRPRLAAPVAHQLDRVELGQLGVVALVWPVIRVVQVRRALYGAVIETGSAAVLALGLFWFVSRAYG